MFRFSPRVPPALVLFLPLALGAGAASAAENLTLAAALARAEQQHPSFDTQRALARIAESQLLQAGLRPVPELRLETENLLGSGPYRGADGLETTLGFSQLIERGGLLDRRVDSARAQQSLQAEESAIAALDVRAEVARRFAHVLSDQAQLAITRETTALAEDTQREVERRVAAARSPLAESWRARIALERAKLDEEHAEHELLSSRRHLAAAMGQREADFGEVVGELLELPEVAPVDELLARLESAPEAQRHASEIRLRESEWRLAQAKAKAGVTIGAGLRRFEDGGDTALLFSAALPLWQGSRQQGAITEAEARRDQGEAERRTALLRAQAQLYALYQEMNHARAEFEAQQERVVPAAQKALEQTRYAWERGRYSLLELRDAQAEWAVQRRRLVEAAAEYHSQLIEIQRLTGQLTLSSQAGTAAP